MYIRRVGTPDAGFLNAYLPYLLRQADQTLSAPFYAVLNRHEVARSEWRVLAVLAEHGELGVLELADAALSPQPTVTHAVRRLEERGLVSRVQGTLDKRQRFISVTPSGAELTRILLGEAGRLEREALADVAGVAELADQLRSLTTAANAWVRDTEPTEEAG